MEIKLAVSLPRDAYSVPVMRRMVSQNMSLLGVTPEVSQDLLLALTEACSNVLQHAGADDEYEVSAGIDDRLCVIEVVDTGHGFDGADHGHLLADEGAERGRGIQLMRALVDNVDFHRKNEQGTVVRLEKQLEWTDDAPVRRLTEGHAEIKKGPWEQGAQRAQSSSDSVTT